MLLFKRMGRALRGVEDREWLLLFLETLGVLAGILIAFELNEWASRESEQAKQHNELERLFEEATIDVAQLRSERDFTRKMTNLESDFAIALSGGTCPPASQWDAVATVNMFPTITVRSSVYDEVINSGGLSSIRSVRAREAVSNFHSALAWADGQNSGFRAHAFPAVAVDDPRVTLTYDAKADEPEVFSYDRATLCSDKKFRNRMVDRVRDHGAVYNLRKGLTASAIKMCASLGALLNRDCTPSEGGLLTSEDQRTAKAAADEVRRED